MRPAGARLRLTRHAAVLGRPIAHSLSPRLHTAAYEALGLTAWCYDAVDCAEADLAPFLAGLDESWAGLSLTMPLKRVGLALAASAGELARAVGAANTLLPDGAGGWRAENTDVVGIEAALRGTGVDRPARAVLLGAGGTAQAALVALDRLGAGSVDVVVRDPVRVGALRATAARLDRDLDVRPWSAAGLAGGWDVLVSTVPAGAGDGLADSVTWPAGAVLLDVIYAPWPTALAAAATGAGLRVVGGAEVLLHQAAAQVALMTGRVAPLPAMRAVLPAPGR